MSDASKVVKVPRVSLRGVLLKFKPDRTPNQLRSRLIQLPRDLKLGIFRYFLVVPIIYNPVRARQFKTKSRERVANDVNVDARILRTCRDMYAAGWEMLYHQNVFRFDDVSCYAAWTRYSRGEQKHVSEVWHLEINVLLAKTVSRNLVFQFTTVLLVEATPEWRQSFSDWQFLHLRTLKIESPGLELLRRAHHRGSHSSEPFKPSQLDVFDYVTRAIMAPSLQSVRITNPNTGRRYYALEIEVLAHAST